MVVDVGDPLRLIAGGAHDVARAVTETRHHRPARAGVEQLEAVARVQADALSALDVRVAVVEQAREDARLGSVHGADGAHRRRRWIAANTARSPWSLAFTWTSIAF
ncbi:MAG: hypothetical protein JO153_11760, partial [Solirubrobacterales bacterium]|nr:hypothetical protein [Solirubrobacterales bacterium]